MHALLNPVKVAQPVQNRPDPVVLQIRLNVILEILALFDVDLFYSRINPGRAASSSHSGAFWIRFSR